MTITNKSKNSPNIACQMLYNILRKNVESIDNYVEQIIICDGEDLESEIKIWDSTESLTDFSGCVVNGKTILISKKSIIFITTNILQNFNDDIEFDNEGNIHISDKGFISLKTIFHEIGHANRNYYYGNIITKKITHSYEETLHELWKILRDEYFAEMFCSNILKIDSSIKWYGGFNDDVEAENFIYYLSLNQNNNFKLDWNFALQLLHQYYFVPLFQKAGFLEGSSKLLSLKHINICRTIQEIQNCNVITNDCVPLEFNEIVLRKWTEFKIEDGLKE